MRTVLTTTLAVALAAGLSACTGGGDDMTDGTGTSTSTAGSPSAAGTTGPGEPAETSGTDTGSAGTIEGSATRTGEGPSTSTSATPTATVTPRDQGDGTVERLTDKGGIVTKGAKVTFVYTNGLRYTVDTGKDIPRTGPVKQTTDKGTLEIREDGSATWAATGESLGAVTVDANGAGTMIDGKGLVTVSADGATACLSSKGLNLVEADGSKTQVDGSGVIVLDEDGKTTSYDMSGRASKGVAATFNQCGPDSTVQVDLTADVLFEYGKADLTTGGRSVIASAAKIIKENGQGKTVSVVGHTDSKGTPELNMTLGMKRARAVETELKKTVPSQKIVASSKGQAEPVAANTKPDGSDNPEGRAKNRRVVISWQK